MRKNLDVNRLSKDNKRAVAEEVRDKTVLDELSYNPDPEVRLAVAGNFCVLISTLERLNEDEDENVKAMAERTLEVLLCG